MYIKIVPVPFLLLLFGVFCESFVVCCVVLDSFVLFTLLDLRTEFKCSAGAGNDS